MTTSTSYAHEPGRPVRVFVQDINRGGPRPLGPEGYTVGRGVVSPDDSTIAGISPEGNLALIPVAGGTPQPVPGAHFGDRAVGWHDRATLYVTELGSLHPAVYTLNIKSGGRKLWKDITPADPAGLIPSRGYVAITPDGKTIVYEYIRSLDQLFWAEPST
jgi:hypothetical protein